VPAVAEESASQESALLVETTGVEERPFMKRFSQIVLAAALFSLFAGAQASGAPILITGGFLQADGIGVLSAPSTIEGTEGFSLTTSVAYASQSGTLEALLCDGTTTPARDCAPGGPISFNGILAEGGDNGLARSAVTVNGKTYTDFSPSSMNPSFLVLFFSGSAIAPEFGDLSPQVVSAPFTMRGQFVDNADQVSIDFTGKGIATVWLTPGPIFTGETEPIAWVGNQVRYDFVDASAVPEPSSVMLLGSGLMALRGTRRRRRDRAA
jgi:hypothetical protein